MTHRPSSLVTLLLLCAFGLAACAPRTAPPDEPTPTPPAAAQGEGPGAADSAAAISPCPETPEAGMLPFGRLESVGMGRAVTEGLCESVAPAEGVYISFEFPGGVAEDAIRSALQVAGGELTRLDVLHPEVGARLVISLGPAQPGEITTVQIRGPVGMNGAMADLGFRLRREASATATADVSLNGGDWRPLNPGEYLPQEPLRLRVTFSRPLQKEQVESRFSWPLTARKDTAAVPYQLTWQDDRTLLLDLPEPPPSLFADLSYIEDDRGLRTRGQSVYLHTGEAPSLVALDPATGQETALGPAPIDVEYAIPSPDGRWAALSAVRPDSYTSEVWLVEARTGQVRQTGLVSPVHSNSYYWFADRLVVPGGGAIQEWDLVNHQKTATPVSGIYASPLSPDGRYLAGFEQHYGKEDPETWLTPLTLLLFDLTTRTEQSFPEVGAFRARHNDSPPYVPMAWSEDGRQLIVRQHGGSLTEPQDYWAALDLTTGAFSPIDAERATDEDSVGPFTSAAGWTFPSSGWGEVSLLSPEGSEVSYGQGLPLAWRSDGQLLLIRWPDHEYRRFPGL